MHLIFLFVLVLSLKVQVESAELNAHGRSTVATPLVFRLMFVYRSHCSPSFLLIFAVHSTSDSFLLPNGNREVAGMVSVRPPDTTMTVSINRAASHSHPGISLWIVVICPLSVVLHSA